MSSCMPVRVELVELIHVSGDRGCGTPDDPHRVVSQYWSKDGRLLADTDDGGLGGPVDAMGFRLRQLLCERDEARARVAELQDRLHRLSGGCSKALSQGEESAHA